MLTGKTCLECKMHKQISEFYTANSFYKKKNRQETLHIHFTSRCKPCHSNHISKKRLDNKEYYKAKRKEYFEKYPSARLQQRNYVKRYEKNNPEKVQAFRKNQYQKNREHLLDLSKQWRLKNRDYCIIRQKEYYQKNKKRLQRQAKEYYCRNRDIFLAKQKERRAKKKLLESK